MINVTDANFKTEAIEHKGPVLIDFSASWCGPCKMVAPALNELSSEFEGKVKVIKVDVDDAPVATAEYEVRSIPCFVFLKDGKEIDRAIGAQSKSQLKDWMIKNS